MNAAELVTANAESIAADRLHRAARERVPCDPVRELLPAGDVGAAYRVQALNVQRRLAAGARLVGRKIGLTSEVVQRQLGVDQPDYGALFADMAHSDGDSIAVDALLQPKAEAEVALVLERPITSEAPSYADIASAVAYVLPAIEVVDSRIAGWDIGLVDTIADNASAGRFVLGTTPRRLDGLDLRTCGMVMQRGTQVLATGAGAACLGHPLAAAAWLARRMVEIGDPLQAGEIVLTGALGPMTAVRPGDVVDAHIGGLGSVRIGFGAAQ